jgi:hypothetical protein
MQIYTHAGDQARDEAISGLGKLLTSGGTIRD